MTTEKMYSVRGIKALMEDCLADGVDILNESELLEIIDLEIKSNTFTEDQIKEIRRIANDVFVGNTE